MKQLVELVRHRLNYIMSRRTLYNYLFFLLPLIYFLSLPIATGDLAVWIAHGKYFLQTGNVLRHDIFSVLPTKDLNYPVGSSVVYALIYNLYGLIGVSLFHKIILLIISYVWFKSSLAKADSPWSASTKIIVFFSWLGSSLFFIDRPALLGMLPLLLSFMILSKVEEITWKDVGKLIIVNIFWVNTHGSWILLLLMYSWRELWRIVLLNYNKSWKPVLGGLFIGFSSLLNPFGYKIFYYILETANVSRERKISEWAPISFNGPFVEQSLTYIILLTIIIMFFIYFAKVDRHKIKNIFASPFIFLTLLGLLAIRNTALAFFVLIPFSSEFGLIKVEKRSPLKSSRMANILNLGLLGAVFILAILLLPVFRQYAKSILPSSKQSLYDSGSPFKIVKYLNNTADNDPVFNDWYYGSFLLLEQRHKIFIDTRNIIYKKENFSEYLKVINAEVGWREIISKYKIKYILINKKHNANLMKELRQDRFWTLSAEEGDSCLYEGR